MTTARPGLPYPCSPQAKTRDESSRMGKLCDGIASFGNMQISNSRLCESSKCWVYTAVNHPWWVSMLFHRQGLPWLTWSGCTLHLIFSDSYLSSDTESINF